MDIDDAIATMRTKLIETDQKNNTLKSIYMEIKVIQYLWNEIRDISRFIVSRWNKNRKYNSKEI